MIKKIKIYNRFNMDELVRRGKMGLNKPDSFRHDRWYLISVYSIYKDHSTEKPFVTEDSIPVLRKYGCVDQLSLDFWDITQQEYLEIKDSEPEAILFSKDQAKQVVKFLDQLRLDIVDADLVIHCHAGISRSGAIGAFASDYFHMNYRDFQAENPYLMPNHYVRKLLQEEVRLFI